MQQSMPGMANFIQANGGGAGNGFGSANQASMRTGSAPVQMQENPMNGGAGAGTGAFFGTGRTADVPQNVASQPAQQTARKEMRGPAGVDDILKTFESVRRAESTDRAPTPQMPAQQIPMSAAMAAAIDMQSVTSDDFRSVMSDQTAGGTVRRKRRAPPVGNSISLDV
jgi:hypothetical protein